MTVHAELKELVERIARERGVLIKSFAVEWLPAPPITPIAYERRVRNLRYTSTAVVDDEQGPAGDG